MFVITILTFISLGLYFGLKKIGVEERVIEIQPEKTIRSGLITPKEAEEFARIRALENLKREEEEERARQEQYMGYAEEIAKLISHRLMEKGSGQGCILPLIRERSYNNDHVKKYLKEILEKKGWKADWGPAKQIKWRSKVQFNWEIIVKPLVNKKPANITSYR